MENKIIPVLLLTLVLAGCGKSGSSGSNNVSGANQAVAPSGNSPADILAGVWTDSEGCHPRFGNSNIMIRKELRFARNSDPHELNHNFSSGLVEYRDGTCTMRNMEEGSAPNQSFDYNLENEQTKVSSRHHSRRHGMSLVIVNNNEISINGEPYFRISSDPSRF